MGAQTKTVINIKTDAEIAEALQQAGRNVSEAATSLGCTRSDVSTRIQANPALQKIVDDAQAELVNKAIAALDRMLAKPNPDPGAINLARSLRRRSRSRRATGSTRTEPGAARSCDHTTAGMAEPPRSEEASAGLLGPLATIAKISCSRWPKVATWPPFENYSTEPSASRYPRTFKRNRAFRRNPATAGVGVLTG